MTVAEILVKTCSRDDSLITLWGPEHVRNQPMGLVDQLYLCYHSQITTDLIEKSLLLQIMSDLQTVTADSTSESSSDNVPG